MTPGYNGILDIFKDDFDSHPEGLKEDWKEKENRTESKEKGRH